MADAKSPNSDADTTNSAESSTAPYLAHPPAAHLASSSHSPRSSVATNDARHDRRHSSRAASRTIRDPEKYSSSIDQYPSPMPLTPVSANVIRVSYHPDEENRDDELGGKAPRILFYLSGPCFFVSLLTLMYTFLAIVISLLLGPLRSCKIGAELNRLLGPATRLHLGLIHSSGPNAPFRTSAMTAVHLLSPLAAAGVALASWTAAVFWFYVAILGNPDGKDKYNDGRATVLAVRAWWERWLLRSFGEEQLPMQERRRDRNRGG